MIVLLLALGAGLVWLGASTISAVLNISLAVTETISTTESPLIDSADATVKEKISVSRTMDASSTPDGELHAAMQIALIAGAKTVDFTALTRHGGAAVSFSGKDLRAIVLQNPATNANDMTFVHGASNSLAVLGAATYSITLKPGQSFAFDHKSSGPTVGSGAKNMDVTGTGTQVFNLIAVAG